MQAQFNSIYNNPVFTTCLDPLERMAATIYTRSIFNEVKRKIETVGTLNLVEKRRVSTTVVYTMLEYDHPGRPLVTLFDEGPKKGICLARVVSCEKDEKTNVEARSKHGSEIVRDPGVSRTKGAPKKRGVGGKLRKCTLCKRSGHTRRRCVQMRKRNDGVVSGGRNSNEGGGWSAKLFTTLPPFYHGDNLFFWKLRANLRLPLADVEADGASGLKTNSLKAPRAQKNTSRLAPLLQPL
ncbi:hypothetical protein PIB30_080899 [Stylosanthes scabra]|uniref:Uncharacterized protein n=1 Tax=Stylosanthes scabra TaxID=79078 RepID=A0ABU6UTA9_9FABA|nr:hypothetical protein [Stylosanthes scabra]